MPASSSTMSTRWLMSVSLRRGWRRRSADADRRGRPAEPDRDRRRGWNRRRPGRRAAGPHLAGSGKLAGSGRTAPPTRPAPGPVTRSGPAASTGSVGLTQAPRQRTDQLPGEAARSGVAPCTSISPSSSSHLQRVELAAGAGGPCRSPTSEANSDGRQHHRVGPPAVERVHLRRVADASALRPAARR